MIGLDASAAVSVLLNQYESASRIRERMARSDDGLHVPNLFEVEVTNVLRRYALSDVIPEERSIWLLEDFTMQLIRYSHTTLLSRVWELRENVTAYGVAYIVLAETLGAPLVTCDARLAQAPGIRAAAEVYEYTGRLTERASLQNVLASGPIPPAVAIPGLL